MPPKGVGAGYKIERGGSTWGIDLQGARALNRALKALAETDAPFLRQALEESGELLRNAAARRWPGRSGGRVRFAGVRGGKGHTLRAVVAMDHPGARSMEFGRFNYYRGFRGRAVKATGQKFAVGTGRGQRPRPFLGIVDGDAAIAEVQDEVGAKLGAAIDLEWERIGAGGD